MFNEWWNTVSEQLPQLRNQLTEQINQTLAPWLPTNAEEVQVGNHRLRILGKLGEGGYSFVYLAEEILPDTTHVQGTQRAPVPRRFALKKILAGEKEQLALAHRELEAMKRLPKHPNLLPLIESQIVKSETNTVVYMLFLLMETNVWDFVQDRLKSNSPLSPVEAVNIFKQLCHALNAMETPTAGMSHRDVKPHNILLTTQRPLPLELRIVATSQTTKDHGNGDDAAHLIVPAPAAGAVAGVAAGLTQNQQLPHAVLMDFGSVAPATVHITSRTEALSAQEDAERHTTAPYRAPELWDVPSSCTLDTKVDIWAAGCVLYYLLAGETPFERTANEAGGSLMLAIVNGQWKWPEAVVGRYPQDILDLVDMCLKSDPAERPSAADLVEKLESMEVSSS